MNIREYIAAYSEQVVAIDMDKAVTVNTDSTGKTQNTIISFSGLDGDYIEVVEPYKRVLEEWRND